MTNSELKRIAKMLDGHFEKVRELVSRIEDSDREDVNDIISSLDDNMIPIIASAEDILREYYSK